MATHAEQLEESLAMQIRVELTERGMTQKDLAEKAGITRSTLNHYTKGHRSIPMPTLFKFAEVLSVAPSVLLERASDPVAELAEQDASTGNG
ncbi:helix-turn-helix domain-containing protein [Arthrobacter sp. Y81]|uniref:helix-turn-helix domain-containing protein n=1 Tax=Arthrobacter sp. Y81 TaxID=2058897 RepID=UPI0015E2E9D4|nr:helix-turn-helix transcriptional regulator [Arthrobacter sp. Y81]